MSLIPISDDNPTLRTPVMTLGLLAALAYVWWRYQGAGGAPFGDDFLLVQSVCNLGMVPGELTGGAAVGVGVPIAEGIDCVVDREPINVWTPLTSMFLHGSWAHLLGNGLFLWIFGNNVEDSMGRLRFLLFYLLCGLAAAALHVVLDPASPIPTVGASGAISGVMGAYLLLYPRVRVNMTFFPFIFFRFGVPAWLMLGYWFGMQLLGGLPQLMRMRPEVSSGVAFWAHVGGFVAGLLLVKLFENDELVRTRTRLRRQFHPGHY
jgi:membrane associated rhomboid family serine protease